jgi:ferrous iron transport protein A
MVPLGLLGSGEEGEILEIRANKGCHPGSRHDQGSGNWQSRIEDLGIRVGKDVEMLNNGGGSAILVRIGESRIAIGRGMAMKIIVRRKES